MLNFIDFNVLRICMTILMVTTASSLSATILALNIKALRLIFRKK